MYQRPVINQFVVIIAEIVVFALSSSILLFGVYLTWGARAEPFVCWLAPVALFVAVVLTSMVGRAMDNKLPIEAVSRRARVYARAPLAKEAKVVWRKFEVSGKWENGVMIADGAMGTELIKRGLEPSTPAAWWNKERADEVQEVHEGYVTAGAQVTLTNTFDANRKKLEMYGKHKYVEELNRAGVEIARRACTARNVLVVGGMGPTGHELELFQSRSDGAKTKQQLYNAFKEQAVILQEAGVDGIWIEAMTYLAEAVIAVKAASENTQIPVICSMSFRAAPASRPDDFRTIWGDSVSDVVRELKEAGASAVGSNCGEVVEDMPRLARQMRQKTDLLLVFEVNAGRPKPVRKGKKFEAVYSLKPVKFVEIISQIVVEGGKIVGGCCGTTPEYIAAIRNRLK